ncbi:topiosmerase, partial [Staphylococcus aureus]|nr:topiosmerase [Enterococcus faecalis]MDQ7228749.1 topiosmerase [Staphylococcus aureus]HEH3610055.1 topiosmerase [Staphylococcus aureus]
KHGFTCKKETPLLPNINNERLVLVNE